jgi:two-component system, NarL family, sensor histidine kinase DegS
MVRKKFDSRLLDQILNKMIETVGTSKDEIFQICEKCRSEYESITEDLKEVHSTVKKIANDADRLESRLETAKTHLEDLDPNHKELFNEANQQVNRLQTELLQKRQQEKKLLNRSDELERRLLGIQETIDRADELIPQVSIVMSYLARDLREMGQALEAAELKQDFGLKIIEAQEEERKRLSREIHDGPAQMLANVMMRSELIERIFRERTADEAFEEMKNFRKMVRLALYEVRRIIYDLRPMALDDLGLIPTLKKYLQTTEEYHKDIKISFTNFGLDQRMPTKYEVSLFRLIQEAVHNSIKHAEAKVIEVKINVQPKMITVLIKDDGKGFNIDEVQHQSFGIIGMKERVDLVDGEINFDSKVGQGTIVYIKIPVELI